MGNDGELVAYAAVSPIDGVFTRVRTETHGYQLKTPVYVCEGQEIEIELPRCGEAVLAYVKPDAALPPKLRRCPVDAEGAVGVVLLFAQKTQAQVVDLMERRNARAAQK